MLFFYLFGSQGPIVSAELHAASPWSCKYFSWHEGSIKVLQVHTRWGETGLAFWWQLVEDLTDITPILSNAVYTATQIWAIVGDDRGTVRGLSAWQLHSFFYLQYMVSSMAILVPKKQAATNTSSLQGKMH